MNRPTPWKPLLVCKNGPEAPPVVCMVPRTQPTYARPAGQKWSVKERELALHAFRSGGLPAAYTIAAHRTRPAVRGYLQRCGLVPRRLKKPAFTP